MTRWMHENSDKRHRCPACHCVMPWRYGPIRSAVYELLPGFEQLFPRRCLECKDVIALPAWLAWILEIEEV